MYKFKSIFIAVIFSLAILILISCNHFFIKAFRLTYLKGHVTASTDDSRHFKADSIIARNPISWQKHKDYNNLHFADTMMTMLATTKTLSFVVIKDGKLLQENYWLKHNDKKLSNSFSMAKSVTALLLGFALQDGYIKSIYQPITDFFPEFKNDTFAQRCKVINLVTMTSGYDWNEKYCKAFGPTTQSYFGKDLNKLILYRKFISEPNKKFIYQNGTNQLLGCLIERATKKKLTQYITEKIWLPLNMESDALWSEDENHSIKSFCCIHSTAKDFAKMGQLLLQKGMWNGKYLLDSNYIKKATHPYISPQYGFSFWMDYTHHAPFYAFIGHLGQYIICVPNYNLVIVRLGKSRTFKNKNNLQVDVYTLVDNIIKTILKQ